MLTHILKKIKFKFFMNYLRKIKIRICLNLKKIKFLSVSENEIFIIGSLLEKEGLDIEDKKNIFSNF